MAMGPRTSSPRIRVRGLAVRYVSEGETFDVVEENAPPTTEAWHAPKGDRANTGGELQDQDQ